MLSQPVCEDKWVCPSDRHLLLRAKLSSGWSVRTSSGGLLASSVTQHETDWIKQVIQRAQNFDTIEQKRIGVMVHRLEEMRKKSSGNGSSSCILCAEEFRKFVGVSPVMCHDCGKKACNKCSVRCSVAANTWQSSEKPGAGYQLCKICSEGREVWKRSGAWFFRTLPSFILPEAKPIQPVSRYISQPSVGEGSSRCSVLPSANGHYNQRRSLSRRRSSSSDSSDCAGELSGTPVECTQANITNQPPFFVEPAALNGAQVNQREHNKLLSIPTATSFHSSGVEMEDPSSQIRASHPPLNDHCRSAIPRTCGAVELSAYAPVVPGHLGSLSFKLRYDKNAAALFVTIVCARKLNSTDSSGHSDSYVKTELIPKTKKNAKLRTKTKHKTADPDFGEILVHHGIDEEDLQYKKLRLQARNEDRFRHNDFIGEVTVALRHLVSDETKTFTLPLTSKQRRTPRLPRKQLQ